MGTAETSLVARSSSDDGGSQENESTSSPIQGKTETIEEECVRERVRVSLKSVESAADVVFLLTVLFLFLF